ncbi:MAG: ATP-binding protein [Myxococcota bacterium]
MLAFTALELLACAALLVSATTIVVRDPHDAGNRQAGLLIYCGAFWAVCQLLWNTAQDPEYALALVKLSALGWVAIGPLTARFIITVTRVNVPRFQRSLRIYFAFAGLFLMLTWFTPWVHTGVVRQSWGFGYTFGPLYPLFFLVTVGSLLSGVSIAARAYRETKLESMRSQANWIAFGILQLLLVGSITDGVLPFFGVLVPQLAIFAFALTGVLLALSLNRFGYSILSPGTFSREISEAMSEGLLLLRMDGRVRSANTGLSQIVGQSREQLEGRHVSEILPLPRLDPPRELRDQRGQVSGADGLRIPVSVTASLLRDGRGAESGLAVIVRDLRELEVLQSRLVLSGRMAAVGQLAAGVAHEVNNPASYVRTNMLLLREYWQTVNGLLEKHGLERSEDSHVIFADGRDLIDESLEGIERITAIVDQIRRFSHAKSGERERAELHLLIESVARMARPRLPAGVRIERRFGSVPPVECAPRELEQVLLNLLLNAADAVGESGTIRLSTSASGGRARVDVEDDGCGIAPEALERVFDPFFTTKPVGQGTGLGLSISYEIVQRHGGEITVRSEVGRGTQFSVFLPLPPRT